MLVINQHVEWTFSNIILFFSCILGQQKYNLEKDIFILRKEEWMGWGWSLKMLAPIDGGFQSVTWKYVV